MIQYYAHLCLQWHIKHFYVDNNQRRYRKTLQLFQTLHRVCDQYSRAAIGTYVISMTSQPSDALAVLWLWKQTDSGNQPCIPIVPLLETIDDLSHGPDILEGMLAIPAYREHLRGHADRQLIMLGYSDSTKDGGYLSACWSLHQAQRNLVAVLGRLGEVGRRRAHANAGHDLPPGGT